MLLIALSYVGVLNNALPTACLATKLAPRRNSALCAVLAALCSLESLFQPLACEISVDDENQGLLMKNEGEGKD